MSQIETSHPLRGRVIGVADGDTLTLLTDDRRQYRVRLASIDAPERGQPHWRRARAGLAMQVAARRVMVRSHKRDRYGRLVGKVLADGRDVGLSLVRGGLAWHFKEFQREQSPQDRVEYAAAEEEARALRQGIWSEREPVPPWEYRRAKRSRSAPSPESGLRQRGEAP